MKRKRILFIAILGGLLAAVLVWFYLTSLEEKYRQISKPVPVLLARGYIPRGTILKEQMVQVSKIPKEYVQPDVLCSFRDLLNEQGRNVYLTLLPILEGEQVSLTKLSKIDKEIGLSMVIPQGKTAFSLAVDDLNIFGGLLQPGNRVNILGTFEYEDKGKSHVITKTLLQNVEVLSVGKKLRGAPATAPREQKNEQVEDTERTVLTLSLTPTEATMLTFAREKGSLSIVLRPFGDENILEIPSVDFSAIIPAGKDKTITSSGNKEKASSFFPTIEKIQKQLFEASKSYSAE